MITKDVEYPIADAQYFQNTDRTLRLMFADGGMYRLPGMHPVGFTANDDGTFSVHFERKE